MAERPRANSLAVEMPESVASSGTSVSSGNNVRTVSRRSRASTVNMVEPETFEVGMEVSPPLTLKKKLSRLFRPIDTWADEAKEVLAQFDEKLLELSIQEGEKLLEEGVVLADETYKDGEVFQRAVENKERFILQLIKAARLDTLTNGEGRNLYNESLLNMIKRYLEPIIRIFIDRRNPEYLLLLASSPCTAQLVASPEITGRLLRFQSMLESTIEDKDAIMFGSALEFGMGVAVQVALILANGSDIINHESFLWSNQGDLKAILENQEIPIGVKTEELFQKRYSECVKFFANPEVRAVLANKNNVMYNRMRKLNAALTMGGKRSGSKRSGSNTKKYKTRRNNKIKSKASHN